MNRLLFFFPVLLITMFCHSERAHASHAAGGEIIYEWLRDSTYRFYFKFYRDCSGIDEPASQTLCYFNSCGTRSGSVTMTKLPNLPDNSSNGSEVALGCPGYPTRCLSASPLALPGYREWWYSVVITLPVRCDSWTFYVFIGSRNASSNIPTQNLYIEATLNNKDAQNNSSPYFTVKPVPYVCVNMPYSFNNGAVDPNRDSLSFEFIQPRASTSCAASYNATPIPYTAPYSLTNPFATSNTFSFNSVNGEMTFTPSLVSVNTVSVRVSDWRNGVRIGSVMRDIQIQVLPCQAPPTTVTPLTNTIIGGSFTGGLIQGTANQLLKFCYIIRSDSANRILVITDNSAASTPGASVAYTGQGTSEVTGCFSWTPQCADTGYKVLTITVKDSTCTPPGIALSQTFTMPVFIRSGSLTERNIIICRGDEIRLHASSTDTTVTWSALGGSGSQSLSCTSCISPIARPDTTTTYEGRAGNGGCITRDHVTLQVDNTSTVVAITPASTRILCKPGYVDLEVATMGNRPLMNLSCGIAGEIPASPVQRVEIVPANAPISGASNPGSTPFKGEVATSRQQYLLRAVDMRRSGMYSGTIAGMSFNMSSVGKSATYDEFRISLKCTDLSDLPQSAGFVEGAMPVYMAVAPVTIPQNGGSVYFEFDIPYNWDAGTNLIVEICYANRAPVSSSYTYFFSTDYQSTLYSYSNKGSSCGVPGAPAFSSHEIPQMTFFYHQAPEGDFTYRWENGVFIPGAISTRASVFIGESKPIYVSTKSRNGCIIRDTLDIFMPDSFSVVPPRAVICDRDTLPLSLLNATSAIWYEDGFKPAASLNCDYCLNPKATPSKDVIYTVVAGNSYGCTDTIELPVRVKPLPPVAIINNDTLIRYDDQFTLFAEGAEYYTWYPPKGLSDVDIYNPVARPLEPVIYSVIGVTEGCYASDSVKVDIDYRDHLMIPSAFSPNGDGKNDVFRVANHTFQRIVEFRVYNRWGREVYHAEPGGPWVWDGTMDGQLQPMGVYHYLIRIGYPDGYFETLTGDVTLVR